MIKHITMRYDTINDIAFVFGFKDNICIITERYTDIENYIIELFNNDLIDTETDNLAKIVWNGVYYYCKKEYEFMKTCIFIAIDKNNDDAMNIMAYYYGHIMNDHSKMIHYYNMGVCEHNIYSIVNLGKYYKKMKNLDEALRYFIMGAEKGDMFSNEHVGDYYYLNNQEKAIHHYLQAIEKGSIKSMNRLSAIYLKMGQRENAERYLHMAIDLGNFDALIIMAGYYAKHIQYVDKAKIYYQRAIDMNPHIGLHHMALYYKNVKNDMDMSNKYHIMAIQQNNVNSMEELEKNITPLQLYKLLNEITEKNVIINNKMEALENISEIIVFKYKLNYAIKKKNITQCLICHEDDVINIILDCKHNICSNCYVQGNATCGYNYCENPLSKRRRHS